MLVPRCSLGQLEAIEKLLRACFSLLKQVESPRQTCPYRSHDKPCDLKDVILTETPVSGVKEYRWNGQQWVESKPAGSGQRGISLAGTSKPKGRVLEVVADKRGGSAQPTKIAIQIQGDGSVGYHDPAEHPVLVWSTDDASPIIRKGVSKAKSNEFRVHRDKYGFEVDPTGGLEAILAPYWPMSLAPKRYTAEVTVCGVRDEGSVVAANGCEKFEVRTYPSDTYTFRMKVPPFDRTRHERYGRINLKGDRLSGGSVSESRFSETVSASYEEGTKKGTAFVSEEQAYHYKDQTLIYTDSTEDKPMVKVDRAPPSGVVFEICRNGTVEETSHNISEILWYLKNLECLFKEILNKIKNVPQVGWKAELDVSFFAGEIYGTWGWKEHTDHRVFFAYSVGVDLKIVEASGTVSFGLDIDNIFVRVTLKIAGGVKGAIQLSGKMERNTPDKTGPSRGSIGPKGKIDIFAEGEAALGIAWVRAEARAGVKTGFDVAADCCIEHGQGFYIEYEIKLRAIVGYYVKKSAFGDSEEKKYPFTDEHLIKKGKFPEAKKEDPAMEAKYEKLLMPA